MLQAIESQIDKENGRWKRKTYFFCFFRYTANSLVFLRIDYSRLWSKDNYNHIINSRYTNFTWRQAHSNKFWVTKSIWKQMIFVNRIFTLCSLFTLVMCIPFLRISSPRNFVKCTGEKSRFWRKKLIARKLLLPGKIKKVLSRANVRSLERRARNAHDQSEQTLTNSLQK